MEMTHSRLPGRPWMRGGWLTFFLILLLAGAAQAQVPVKKYALHGGKMYIELSKNIKPATLDSFITRFDLGDLPLKEFLKTNAPEIWQKLGWHLEKNTAAVFAISKPLSSLDKIDDPGNRIIFTGKAAAVGAVFPVTSQGVLFGYNRFRSGPGFALHDSVVTFVLRGFDRNKRVVLAGSFNNWQPDGLAMSKTENGWMARVKLGPGKYWYKFVVDGDWITDPDNLVRENDGRGNTNSIYFRPNVNFVLKGHASAKKVYLAGSFNNWKPRDLPMQKLSNGWELPLYLTQGTHTYRFVVDGEWLADPSNNSRLPNEFGDFNSVIRLGHPYVFKLPGYTNARQVVLSGSFNRWREEELFMQKTAAGWELPHTLGPGNYEYKFKVDGKWVADPANPLTVQRGGGPGNTGNSYLILEPNYTFRLQGFTQARQVFLAGDFNNWSPSALPMKRDQDAWIFPVYLSPGKTRYKFVVDGEWIRDPANKLWEQNEYGTGNSIIWLER